MEVIQEILPEHITSLCSKLPRPAHAWSLRLWLFPLGYLKTKVYTTRSQTINHNFEANWSNTGKCGEVSIGKPVNKVARGACNNEQHLTGVMFTINIYIMKCMWNIMVFNVRSFRNNELEIKTKCH
jgi:hypothetical protein